MTGFSARYHATGTSRNASPIWTNPKATAATLYPIKNPSGTYGSPWYVKKDKGNGPNIAAKAAISKKKLPVMCITPPDLNECSIIPQHQKKDNKKEHHHGKLKNQQ
jgi:hypothetical protein